MEEITKYNPLIHGVLGKEVVELWLGYIPDPCQSYGVCFVHESRSI
jgi:hypothetical protein